MAVTKVWGFSVLCYIMEQNLDWSNTKQHVALMNGRNPFLPPHHRYLLGCGQTSDWRETHCQHTGQLCGTGRGNGWPPGPTRSDFQHRSCPTFHLKSWTIPHEVSDTRKATIKSHTTICLSSTSRGPTCPCTLPGLFLQGEEEAVLGIFRVKGHQSS